MDAGGRRQLEKRPRDEEYIRLVYKFRENCPLLDLKDFFVFSKTKVFLRSGDGRYSLLKSSGFSWGGR